MCRALPNHLQQRAFNRRVLRFPKLKVLAFRATQPRAVKASHSLDIKLRRVRHSSQLAEAASGKSFLKSVLLRLRRYLHRDQLEMKPGEISKTL